jgi:hypothetical protein
MATPFPLLFLLLIVRNRPHSFTSSTSSSHVCIETSNRRQRIQQRVNPLQNENMGTVSRYWSHYLPFCHPCVHAAAARRHKSSRETSPLVSSLARSAEDLCRACPATPCQEHAQRATHFHTRRIASRILCCSALPNSKGLAVNVSAPPFFCALFCNLRIWICRECCCKFLGFCGTIREEEMLRLILVCG